MKRQEESTIIYSDVSKNPAAIASGLVYNLQSIKQSLDNLFATPYGTRSMQPTYGHTFDYLLGELMTPITTQEFYAKAIESVRLNEPRVLLDSALTTVTPLYEQNHYRVFLVFNVRGLSLNDKFSYEITIQNAKDKA